MAKDGTDRTDGQGWPDDMTGKGPTTDYWWHDAMEDELTDILEEDGLPQSAEDLVQHLRFYGITMHEKVHGYDGPLAELCFSSILEEEHGIGIVTDGERILGQGYQGDMALFPSNAD
jgi:hypothetical protein